MVEGILLERSDLEEDTSILGESPVYSQRLSSINDVDGSERGLCGIRRAVVEDDPVNNR